MHTRPTAVPARIAETTLEAIAGGRNLYLNWRGARARVEHTARVMFAVEIGKIKVAVAVDNHEYGLMRCEDMGTVCFGSRKRLTTQVGRTANASRAGGIDQIPGQL